MRAIASPLLLFVVLTSCSLSLPLQSDWRQRAWAGSEPCSSTEELAVACTDAMHVVRTELTCSAAAGTLTVTVLDPAGVQRNHQVVHRGEQELALCWPAQAGTWRLQITALDFAGAYDVTLAATSRPIDVRVDLVSDTLR